MEEHGDTRNEEGGRRARAAESVDAQTAPSIFG